MLPSQTEQQRSKRQLLGFFFRPSDAAGDDRVGEEPAAKRAINVIFTPPATAKSSSFSAGDRMNHFEADLEKTATTAQRATGKNNCRGAN